MKVSLLSAVLLTLLTGCALPQAVAEQPAAEKEQETRIVVMQDGEKKEWRFTGENWRDSDEWQQFIAGLAPEQQAKLEKLLASAPPLPPMPPHPPKVSWQHDGASHIIIHAENDGLTEERIVQIQTEVKGKKFDAIKHLLQDTDLTKEQLQQLQALLDSKH